MFKHVEYARKRLVPQGKVALGGLAAAGLSLNMKACGKWHKYNTNAQIQKYTNTCNKIQMHKYTNTQIYKYTNTKIQKYIFVYTWIDSDRPLFKHLGTQ